MEDFAHQLELLLDETRPMDASFNMDSSLSTAPNQSAIPMMAPKEAHVETSSDLLIKGVGDQHPSSPKPFNLLSSTDSQFLFVPTPSFFSAHHASSPTATTLVNSPANIQLNNMITNTTTQPNYPTTTTEGQLGMGLMPPFPMAHQQIPHYPVPPSLPILDEESIYHLFRNQSSLEQLPLPQQPIMPIDEAWLGNKGSFIQHKSNGSFPSLDPSYLNPSGNPADPNWEAIESFLRGHVRPGADVVRIYKCSVCNLEFPNAQAFGGHMSSHSQHKRGKRSSGRTGGQFKRVAQKAPPHPLIPNTNRQTRNKKN